MRFTKTLAVGVVAAMSVATGALAPEPAGATTSRPSVSSTIDECLLGTWTSEQTTISVPTSYGTIVLTGGQGTTVTWAPDGLEVSDYANTRPYTGTVDGFAFEVTERGVAQAWSVTSGGNLSAPKGYFSNTVTFTLYVLGSQQGTTKGPSTPGTNPYTCSDTTLVYGPSGKTATFQRTSGAVVGIASSPDGKGYWTATTTGAVSSAGDARTFAGTSGIDDIVGVAPDPAGQGLWLVGANGSVYSFGAAAFHGSLPSLGVKVNDIVAIAPTADGSGYWLVGADGGEFAFGDATFHGSLPGIGVHVHDVEGMVATPSGSGYLMVGADGGVFAFGAVYHGSLPGLHIHVDDIVGILPTAGEAGYVLVGADGGAFVFGTGAGFYGSLPGRGIKVSDVTGLALTPDGKGYWMVRSSGPVYAFGSAVVYG